MTLGPGARLGPYEITAPLGEGGMGKVWRATGEALQAQRAVATTKARVIAPLNGRCS